MFLRLQIYWLFLLGIVFFPIGITAQKPLQNYSSTTLDSLSYDLFYKRQYNASLYYNLELVEKLKKEVGEKDTTTIEAMELVALSHYFLGDYESAEKNIQNLLDIQAKERGKNNDLYLDLWYVQLAVLTQMEKEAAASKIEVELPNIWKIVGVEKCEKNYTDLIDFIASTHSHLGQYEEEERLYLLLKRYWKKKEGVEGSNYLETLSNLADTYFTTDRNEAGLQLLLQVLETRERLEPIPSESYIEDLRYLAVNYGHNGKDDEAEKLFKKAALLCEKHLGKNHPEYGWICQKRADFYTYLNREKEAIVLYQTANAIFEKTEGKLSSGYTFSLNNMARAYARLEQFDKAEKTLLEALQLKEQIYGKKHTEYYYTLNTLAGLYLQKGDPKTALEYDLRGFVCLSPTWDTLPELTDKFLSEIPDASFISTHFTFGALVDLLTTFNVFYDKNKETKWLEKTYLLCQSALKYCEKTKNALANENDQMEILVYYNHFSKFGVWAAYKLSEQSNKVQAEKYAQSAFSFTEQNKAVVLAGALKAEQAVQMSDIPADLAFQEKRLKEELGELKKQLMDAAIISEKNTLRTQFTEKSKELDVLKKTLEKDYPDYYDLKYSNHIASIKDIQKTLPEKTLCVAYQIGKKVSYIFGITKTDFFVIQKDTLSAQIKIHTEQLRRNLSDYNFINNNSTLSYNQFTTSAHWFYNHLLKPALDKCQENSRQNSSQTGQINKLILIPDGELGHLPFEVFLIKPAEALKGQEAVPNYHDLHYLLNDYTVSYSYSASLWVINAEMSPQEGNHRMLGMAAAYSKDSIDNQIAKERGDFLTQLRRSLEPLPAAQEEVQSLATNFKGDFFYGNDVNESFFRTQAQHYSIIHLAMHGILDNKTPILSGLLFSENKDKMQDNFLQAYEIAHLKLDAELVVLSACETGYGQFQQGEGVMSLARSFMYAGVPSLVVSMWKVNDHSTAVIMKYFYENLNKGMDKAESLRQAKLSYLKIAKGPAAHPAFWSPFIQFGNSSPLYLQGKSFGWWWGLLGVGVLFLGGVFMIRNKAKKAVAILAILSFLGNPISAQSIDSLKNQISALSDQTRYKEALQLSQKLLELVASKHDTLRGETLSSQGLLYYHLGFYEDAQAVMEEALVLYEKHLPPDHDELLNLLNNLSMVYNAIGQYERAAVIMERIMALHLQKYSKDLDYTFLLSNLAQSYYRNDQTDKARKVLQEVAEIREALLGNKHPYYAKALSNWGTMESKLGNYKKSIDLLMLSCQVFESSFGHHHITYGLALYNLAYQYQTMKGYDTALDYYKKSLSVYQKSIGHRGLDIAQIYNEMATCYIAIDSFATAWWLLEESLSINTQTVEHLVFDKFLWESIGSQKFISLSDALRSFQLFWTLFYAQYQKTQDTQHLDKAMQVLRSASALNQSTKNQVLEEADKLKILGLQTLEISSKALKTIYILGEHASAKEALFFMEQNKAILLAEALKADNQHSFGDLPDSIYQAQKQVFFEMNQLKQELAQTSDSTAIQQLQEQRIALQKQAAAIEKNIALNYPQYQKLKQNQNLANPTAIKAQLAEGTLFMEYFIADMDSAVYLLSISKEKQKLFLFPISKTVLKNQIKQLRQALTQYKNIAENPADAYKKYTESAFWFYQNLVQPALKEFSCKKLVIIADGELGHLPFEVFLVTQAPQKQTDYSQLHYLINDYHISYNYSATLFFESQERLKNKTPQPLTNGKMLAIAADYKYKKTNTFLNAPHLHHIRKTLIELPAAIEEVDQLAQLFKGDFLLGADANELFFKKQATEYSVIHLAMHGLLNQHHPILSSLAFTDTGDSLQDNFLQAYEIAHLKLNADLVVLSACETGYGKFQQGEGVMSLARSFMYAGVPSLVVSLWQVNDHSTSVIMQFFYQYLADGMAKDAALRQAKLDYLKMAQGIAAHPAFWSAFIQLGDSRPIVLETTLGLPRTWVIAGIILVILGIGAARMRLRQV